MLVQLVQHAARPVGRRQLHGAPLTLYSSSRSYSNHIANDKPPNKKMAVLVDAENISSKYIESVLNDIQERHRGETTIRQMYGNFSNLKWEGGWESIHSEHLFDRVCTTKVIKRKSNTADFHLMMDAMKVLYTQPHIQGFALVTSDSDFQPLVKILLDHDKVVIGYGHSHTPLPLQNAYDTFMCVEDLSPRYEGETDESSLSCKEDSALNTNNTTVETISSTCKKSVPVWLLQKIQIDVSNNAGGDGWTKVTAMEEMEHLNLMVQRYGFSTLREFLVGFPDRFQYKVRKKTKGTKAKSDRVFVKSLECELGDDADENELERLVKEFDRLKTISSTCEKHVPVWVLQKIQIDVSNNSDDDGWTKVTAMEEREHLNLMVQHYGFSTLREFFVGFPDRFQYTVRKKTKGTKAKSDRVFVKSLECEWGDDADEKEFKRLEKEVKRLENKIRADNTIARLFL